MTYAVRRTRDDYARRQRGTRALRTTLRQPMGFVVNAPKHAHGGRRPCARRTTSSTVNATSSDPGNDGHGRPSKLSNQQRPITNSTNGTTAATAAGTPSSAGLRRHCAGAAILVTPETGTPRRERGSATMITGPRYATSTTSPSEAAITSTPTQRTGLDRATATTRRGRRRAERIMVEQRQTA